MVSFTSSGDTADDFWLADGSRNFSILPANTITGWTIDLPLRLHIGVKEAYGRLHMEKHLIQFHDRWSRSIPELIYHKLGHSAAIFTTDKQTKMKLQFGTTFKAILIVERRYKDLDDGTRDEYLSMVSFYPPRQSQIEDPNNSIASYDSFNLRRCQTMTKTLAATTVAVTPQAKETEEPQKME